MKREYWLWLSVAGRWQCLLLTLDIYSMCLSAPWVLLILNITPLRSVRRNMSVFLIHLHLPISLFNTASEQWAFWLGQEKVTVVSWQQCQRSAAQHCWRNVLTWPSVSCSSCKTFKSLVPSHRRASALTLAHVYGHLWPFINTPNCPSALSAF